MDNTPESNSPRISGELVLGIVLGLVPWGLSLLGMQTNIWLGGPLLLIAFLLLAHYFWVRSQLAITWRIVIVLICAIVALGWIAMRMRQQYRLEHSSTASSVQSGGDQTKDENTRGKYRASVPPQPPSRKAAEASLEFIHTAIVAYSPDRSVFLPNYPVKVHVIYANTKGGTARQVYAQCAALIFSGSLNGETGLRAEESNRWNEFKAAWLSNISTGVITDSDIAGHDKSHFCLAQTTLPLKPEQAQRLRDQIDVIYVLGTVKWKDASGDYESDICSFFLPKEQTPDPKAPMHWRACITGHNVTRRPFRVP